MQYFTQHYKSPLGYIIVTATNTDILHIDMSEKRLKSTTESNALTQIFINQIEEYFAGSRTEFNLPYSWDGTVFQKAVWNALIAIPYGETVTYTDIANTIGRPKAVRAVGQAVHHNPFSITVPCHRVIGKNRGLTGYAHGIDKKQWLLLHEQQHANS